MLWTSTYCRHKLTAPHKDQWLESSNPVLRIGCSRIYNGSIVFATDDRSLPAHNHEISSCAVSTPSLEIGEDSYPLPTVGKRSIEKQKLVPGARVWNSRLPVSLLRHAHRCSEDMCVERVSSLSHSVSPAEGFVCQIQVLFSATCCMQMILFIDVASEFAYLG